MMKIKKYGFNQGSVYMELEEWGGFFESSQGIAFENKWEAEVEKILNCPEIKELRKHSLEESDKNINGFMIPLEANNNEDYEIKLKHTLEDFAKKIDRPAFKKEPLMKRGKRYTMKTINMNIY